jgi:sugar-specific transcriptional regulator TrmB
MNEKLLEEIGLTKGEIKVYLTLLKLGETTTGKIIQEAKISSGKIYEILDKLIDKGIASYIVKEKTKYFKSASPERILDYLREKEKDLKKKEEELQKELPFLLNIKKGKNEHETTLFKGLKGIQTAIFEALENMQRGEEVLAMGVRSTKDEKYNILWEKWHNERLRKKINCRILFSDKGSEYYKLFSKMSYTGVRIVEGLTPSAIDIIGKRVLIFTYGEEPSCLSIYDGEIAQSFRTLFESLWRFAKNNV